MDENWMKNIPRAFHRSEPHYRYPTIKDNLWDLDEEAHPIKTSVNSKLVLDKEITPAVADNGKFTFVHIILTISTFSHSPLNILQPTTISILQASR